MLLKEGRGWPAGRQKKATFPITRNNLWKRDPVARKKRNKNGSMKRRGKFRSPMRGTDDLLD